MSAQPTYLPLLVGIANAESDAHCYLTAWRETTTDTELQSVLATIASREGEHGMSFAKRVLELGFPFERKEGPSLPEKLTMARSARSDAEKAEFFGLTTAEKILTFFDTVFKDHSIDIRTGELLGRYIAEEHDSARLAMRCYENLCAGSGSEDRDASAVDRLETKVDALCRAVDELRQIVCAQTMPAANDIVAGKTARKG